MAYKKEHTLEQPPELASRWSRARSFVREALRDNEVDFTTGPIRRGLGLLAIPMMLEMGMEAIFAVVDIAFVSRLGTNAVAAVGLTEALITELYAVAVGLGVTAMVSRRIGEKDQVGAAYVTGQAIWIGAVLALLIGVAGIAFAEDLLRLMGAEAGVIAEGSGFTAVLLGGSATILFLFLLNAAYTIAIRMMEFVFLPAWGLGNAAATMVGQNLGAARPDRAEAATWTAARYNALFMTTLGGLFFVFAPQIVGLFTADPEILRFGTSCLRILGLGYPMYAVGMIMVQAFNGAGDTRTPLYMNLFVFWVTQIPLAWYLASPMDMGPNGVFWAIVISESLLTVLGVVIFRQGAWRLQKV